jgi:ferredoxin/flavodoxin
MASSDENKSTPLKGIICYYSGSGNTRLACQYVSRTLQNADFKLFNIVRDGVPDFSQYAIAGFATFTDFLDPPFLVQKFVESLPPVNAMPAFVLNTYGFINGKTQHTLARWAAAKGFSIIAGHSLHMPESYPPMVAGGRGNEQAPNPRELQAFNGFVSALDASCGLLLKGGKPVPANINSNWLWSMLPSFSRTRSRHDMSIKYVDKALCDECGICEKLCPYGALTMQPKPVFDQNKCYGCWSCYNHCPHKAIYTHKFRGRGHYPKPIQPVKDKLGA